MLCRAVLPSHHECICGSHPSSDSLLLSKVPAAPPENSSVFAKYVRSLWIVITILYKKYCDTASMPTRPSLHASFKLFRNVKSQCEGSDVVSFGRSGQRKV